MRAGRAAAADAAHLLDRALTLVRAEPDPDPRTVLELALASGRSAYDCAFVAAALELGMPLVTRDAALLRCFPDVAAPLSSRSIAPNPPNEDSPRGPPRRRDLDLPRHPR